MNCREFIIEFEDCGTLSEPARLHLTVCTECKKSSEQQTQVWMMIEEFKPVAVPNDFDFHVKARIAQAKPSDFQKSSFLPILRYVLPLSLAVLLLGVFVINSQYFSSATTANDLAQTTTENPAVTNQLPINIAPDSQYAFAPASEEKPTAATPAINANSLLASNAPKQRKDNANTRPEANIQVLEVSNRKIKDEMDGGSHDKALSGSKSVFPFGINPNGNFANAPQFNPGKPLDEKETISIIGMETVLEKGGRTVKSVQPNSIADRSGVKVGDVIEKVNNKSLTILRGMERIEVILK